MTPEDTDRIPTNLRTLLILEILGRSDRPMTATEIKNALGLSKPTVHRLCATLEHEGFIIRSAEGRHYHAARRSRELGTGLLFNSRTHILRRQILIDVAKEIGETINFVVPEAQGMRYLDRVETDWAFQVKLPIGSHVPFHCTASGKCFLASLTPEMQKNFIAGMTIEKLTEATKTDPTELLAELAQIKTRGYALDEEEFIEGTIAVAVPVTDAQDRFIAALASHGPAQRISVDRARKNIPTLQTAAKRLQTALYTD